MDVSLLGPIEVRLDGRPIALGARKQRAVLAMLALQVDRTVSADRLAEGLWGEELPPSAAKMVQLYVSRLRRLLEGNGAEIVTRGRGYEFRLADGQVDAVRFERLLESARPREALALWRSEPLSDVAEEPFAGAAIRRLEELRARAAELAIDADLAAGRHAEVLGEVEALLEAEPLRERLHGQRMLALYRSGRQGDALEAYREARQALVTQIGVEPGPELRRLQDAILRQDASLEPPGLERAELPPELDTRTPLDGRDRELDWLRGHWRRVQDGAGGLVLITGAAGIGKTRLVAELAAEVLGEGGAVSYAAGLPRDGAPRGPALLVVDDVDRATEAPARLADLPSPQLLVVATASTPGDVPAPDALTLGPLTPDAIRSLARRYVGAHVEIPVDRLLAASGGVPRALHVVTAEWARGSGRSSRRRRGEPHRQRAPGAPRGRGRPRGHRHRAAGRPRARRAERERRCRHVSLQGTRVLRGRRRGRLLRARAARGRHGRATHRSAPAGDPRSVGQRQVVRAARGAARSAGGGCPARAASAGSRRSCAPASTRCAHSRDAPGDPRVVAVDQFEELFTACRDEDERSAFVDALVERTRRRVLVLIAVRADFYARCAAYPELARLLGANHVLVGPMRRDELRRAIELPARRAGLHVEPDLVEALVAEVEDRPGALPLLSTSLLELWRRRDGRVLRLADHEHAGGVSGAVARLAEQAYERLSAEQQPVARRVLLRLAGEGEGDAVVRRRVGLAELGGGDVSDVVRVLADERLVTIGDGHAEVAHEALLREWPRLREWLQEDAEARRLHQHLIRSAQDWQAAGRERAELYRGARLAAALDWSATHELELNALERDFLAQSRAEAEAESRRQRRANRRLRTLLGGLAALFVLALAAGGVAVSQRGQARDVARTADAQRLGAEAQTRENLDQALLLARAGVDLDDSVATRGQLLSVLTRDPQVIGTLAGDWEPLHYQSLSPDGRRLALGSSFGTVTFFDTARRRPVGRPYRLENGHVTDIRFSPDGMTLAVAGWDEAKPRLGGVVDLVDARTHARRRQIVVPPFPGGAAMARRARPVPPQRARRGRPAGPRPDRRGWTSLGAAPLRRGDRGRRLARRCAWVATRRSRCGAASDRRRLFVTSREDNETYMLDAERLRVLRRWPVGDFAGVVSARRESVRAGVPGWRGAAARPSLGEGPELCRRARRERAANAVLGRRADARDERGRRRRDRLGRRARRDAPDALGSCPRAGLGPRGHTRRTYRIQRRRGPSAR